MANLVSERSISTALTDASVLALLGRRLERHRIAAGLTQAALAERAGVSKRTLERIEAGQGSELASLLRLLRALNLLAGVDALIPEPPASPLEALKLKGRTRRRVRSRAASPAPSGPWEWAE
ncbi:MAG: helix-turn-helix domain-containing protein [Gammaproteobacteria bacterium]|nr:helix-turn-helix domain-containing protein [Gammaproteobacteria bacterium]